MKVFKFDSCKVQSFPRVKELTLQRLTAVFCVVVTLLPESSIAAFAVVTGFTLSWTLCINTLYGLQPFTIFAFVTVLYTRFIIYLFIYHISITFVGSVQTFIIFFCFTVESKVKLSRTRHGGAWG
jgi:hypothetical protein